MYRYAKTGVPSAAFVSDTFSEGDIQISGQVNYEDEVTAVELTEHTYLDLGTDDEQVTLFDGSAEGTVTNAKVIFNDPCHDLTANGVTIHESGANYAVISGSGTLIGYKYTHSVKVLRRDIAQNGETNEVSVKNVTLVNPLNSSNVADRLAAYYGTAVTVDASIYISGNNPRPGRQYTFTSPFGDEVTGFVEKMDINAAGDMLAQAHIVTDYTPTGQGNNYSHAVLMTEGNWTVPDGVTSARIILIGGGNGGMQGEDGEDGGTVTSVPRTGYYNIDDPDISSATGGDGGEGGDGGDAGKVLTVNTSLTPGSTVQIGYGTGGTEGQNGTDTTVTVGGTTFSTVNGVASANGVINLFTGIVYARPGRKGENGAKGGDFGLAGGNLLTANGGSAGFTRQRSGVYDTYVWAGGGGGGAAYMKNGDPGSPYEAGTDYYTGPFDGGDGANAEPPEQATYGSGGNGANGGGGGGGGGYFLHGNSGGYYYQTVTPGAGGKGGKTSVGGKGGNGCVLIYY